MSDNPFVRAARAGKQLDYRQLNDGSDDEADISDQIDGRLPKQPHITSGSSEIATPIKYS